MANKKNRERREKNCINLYFEYKKRNLKVISFFQNLFF